MACAGCIDCNPEIGLHEIHITSKKPSFVNICNNLGIKTITVKDYFTNSVDVMTSYKFKGTVFDVLTEINKLSEYSLNADRIKVESHIDTFNLPENGYYEAHYELNEVQLYEETAMKLEEEGFFISSNSKIMITRKTRASKQNFVEVIVPFDIFLLKNRYGLNVVKTVKEYTWLDTDPYYDGKF